MGLDAPSSDITHRIRARRAAGVRAGDIDPALPGEHVVHGTQPGAAIALDRLAAAAEARARRAPLEAVGSDRVVEFEYLPGEQEALGLSVEDGGDVIEDEVEAEVEIDAVLAERQFAEDILTAPTDTPMRLAVIEEKLAATEEILGTVQEQLDGISKALVLIAGAEGQFHVEARTALSILLTPPEEPPARAPWYRRIFGLQ